MAGISISITKGETGSEEKKKEEMLLGLPLAATGQTLEFPKQGDLTARFSALSHPPGPNSRPGALNVCLRTCFDVSSAHGDLSPGVGWLCLGHQGPTWVLRPQLREDGENR